MNWRSFILGAISGAALTAFGVVAHAGYSALDEGIGVTYRNDEMDSLRGESDLLRLITLDMLWNAPETEARHMLERLGVFGFEKPSQGYLVAGFSNGPGQIVIEIRDGRVSNVLNHCARTGVECPVPEVVN